MDTLSGILLHLPPGQLAVAAGIFFLSALIQGMTGFGFVLFSAPMLALITGTKAAIPLITGTAFLSAINLFLSTKRAINYKEISLLLPGSLLAIPAGAWFLLHYDERILRVGLALIILLFAVFSMRGKITVRLKSSLWAFVFGLVSGFCGGAFNANAPAIIIYARLRGWDQSRLKGSMAAFYIITCAVIMISHHVAGLSNLGVYVTALELYPIMYLGTQLGLRITGRMSSLAFERVTQWMLVGLAVLLVVK